MPISKNSPIQAQPWGVLVLLKFWQFSSEFTKTWSSGATECGVWIGNCNVKVWKSTEHKLHKTWRSLELCTNWGKRANPDLNALIESHIYWKSFYAKIFSIWRRAVTTEFNEAYIRIHFEIHTAICDFFCRECTHLLSNRFSFFKKLLSLI